MPKPYDRSWKRKPTNWPRTQASFSENATSPEPTRAQTLIFGWLEEPEISLAGLTQMAERREVEITASGWHQRFTPEAVSFLERLLERLTQVRLEAEATPSALLKRFRAVIVEESSTISLPDELAERWRGCGGSAGSSQATLKLCVRWNVLTGDLHGPRLSAGRHADGKSPFNEQEVPARLILQRVPKEVAEQRRKRLREEAHDHGHERKSRRPSRLSGWTIVVSNVPRRLLSLEESLVVLTVRWQIERLFRLWNLCQTGGDADPTLAH